jgi:hypothetical protein
MSQHLAPLLSVSGNRKLLNQGAREGSAFGGAAITRPTVIVLLSEIIVYFLPIADFWAFEDRFGSLVIRRDNSFPSPASPARKT